MSVVARFYVAGMNKRAGSTGQREFEMYPVSRGPENKKWAAATPSGSIKITVANGPAGDWFEEMLGQDLAITFEARPMLCTKCKGEMTLDQYGQNAEINGESYSHRVCPEN